MHQSEPCEREFIIFGRLLDDIDEFWNEEQAIVRKVEAELWVKRLH